MSAGRFLINKTMSRNGGTLICQLLEGHPQVFFPPFSFNVAITVPRCWPFNGIGQMAAIDFAAVAISKCSVWAGKKWYEMYDVPMNDSPEIAVEALDMPTLRAVSGGMVDEGNVQTSLHAFFYDLLALYDDSYQRACSEADLFVLDADHSFNCGVQQDQRSFGHMLFLQVIRHVYDVIASRKNMLLHHKGIVGDPLEFTLRKEVVFAEATRWIWSVISAVRHHAAAPSRCITVQFESLHRNRANVMQHVADFLGIHFTRSLLLEGLSHASSLEHTHSQFPSSSSLSRVTRGRKSTVVGSAHDVLNNREWEYVRFAVGTGELDWPDMVNVDDFVSYLDSLYTSNICGWLRNENIATLAKLTNHSEIMEVYSSLNFGRKESAHVFE